ncbi:MAG: RNA polymerase sigma-70 factor [Cytophagaceae bacterium]|nr:RNA polymerase sigma-70 factor [Cytophagaceae bacterium]|tara:strand:+ start:375 stop:947 length:573 start_codon:yes stop_codon:yes gene_type:complete
MYKDNLSLIEGLSHGEESAYAHLLKLYHKRLFAYVLTLTHNHAAAEDIIQNVFLKLWEYRDKLDPDYSLKNFLYRSCYNEFVNHYKKNKRITYFDKVYLETVESVIHDSDINLLERKKEVVFHEVSLLPDKCAEVFMLSKREGLTNAEIAEYLNLSVKTVEGHLSKAYTQLRKRLGVKIMSILFLLFSKS